MLDIHDIVAHRYVVQRVLGQGGMGVVYLADDTESGQEVALKMVLLSPGEAYRRFQREFRLMTRLTHPNIVRVYDSGIHQDRPYMVMEYLNCRTLEAEWSTPAHSPEVYQVRLQVLIQLAKALAFIHTQGVIHRDLKPENVMLFKEQAKLMDFGLAKSMQQSTAELTRLGAIMGTASYMSPEQAKGKAIDARSDLYAFGCLIFWAMTGSPPFVGKSLPEVLLKHLNMPPPDLSVYNPMVSEELSKLVFQLMAKAPEDRYSDASEVALKLKDATRIDQVSAFKTVVIGDTIYEDYTPQKLLHSPLLGHGLVMGQLHEGLRQLKGGKGSRFVISAATGLGLSRVLEELLIAARAAGSLVMKLNCHSGVTIPFEIWKEGLQQLERRNPESFEHSLGDLEMILAPLLGRASLTAEIPADVARLRLYQAVDQLLAKLSQEHGLLILLDDVHEADETTLGLLAFLIRGDTAERTMLAVGLHPTNDKLIRQTLQGFAGQQLQLNPLSHQESLELIHELLGGEVEQPLQRYVADRAQGNPLFITEVLKSLLTEGHISKRLGLWHWSAQDINVPNSIEDILLEQLKQLSERAYKSLQAASAIGVQYDFDLLLELLEVDEDELLDDTDELLNYALIQELPHDSFRFASPLMRTLVHRSLNPRRRRRYHQRLAELLTAEPDTPPAVLADHLAEGPQPERAVSFALQAADEAFEVFANDIAETYYRLAFKVVPQDSINVGLVKLRLGSLLDRVGRWEEAEALFQEAAEGDTLASALHRWGKLKEKQGQLVESEKLLKQALDLDAQNLDVLSALGFTLTKEGKFDEADVVLSSALSLANSAPQAHIKAKAQADLGWLENSRGRFDAAVTWFEAALALINEDDQPILMAQLNNWMGIARYALGQVDEAKAQFESAIKISEKISDLQKQASVLQNLAQLMSAQEEVEEAIEAFHEANKIAYRIGSEETRGHIASNMSLLRLSLGKQEEALKSAQEAVDIFSNLKMPSQRFRAQLALVEAFLFGDDAEQALTVLDKMESDFDDSLPADLTAEYYLRRAQTALIKKDQQSSETCLQEAIERARGTYLKPLLLDCLLVQASLYLHDKVLFAVVYRDILELADELDDELARHQAAYLMAVQQQQPERQQALQHQFADPFGKVFLRRVQQALVSISVSD